MKIINIVDSLAKVNFGIWNSAVSTAQILKKTYNVESELWYPKPTEDLPDAATLNGCILREIGSFNPKDVLTDNCILVSHGCWQLPTRLAYKLHKQFETPWMYVPHGMLEPNSIQQKYWFKQVYFALIEKRFTRTASVVRAVSLPEKQRLLSHYKRVTHIANGVRDERTDLRSKNDGQFLFMARIHKQKGILELSQAWKASALSKSGIHTLLIVGPDDGELSAVLHEIENISSIQYLGSKYGDEKKKLLSQSRFYILPSRAEGFPTSVVEAMQYGLIPIISDNCNFPESIDAGLAIRTGPDVETITEALNKTLDLEKNDIESMSVASQEFIHDKYLLSRIANLQYEAYITLLQ